MRYSPVVVGNNWALIYRITRFIHFENDLNLVIIFLFNNN